MGINSNFSDFKSLLQKYLKIQVFRFYFFPKVYPRVLSVVVLLFEILKCIYDSDFLDTYKFSSKGICELCGNGQVEGDETCDAGSSQGCTSNCLGVRNGYSCHGGSSTSPTICAKIPCSICGNGIVNSGE